MARDKLRFLEEGGVKRFAPEPLGGHDPVGNRAPKWTFSYVKRMKMVRNRGGFGVKP